MMEVYKLVYHLGKIITHWHTKTAKIRSHWHTKKRLKNTPIPASCYWPVTVAVSSINRELGACDVKLYTL